MKKSYSVYLFDNLRYTYDYHNKGVKLNIINYSLKDNLTKKFLVYFNNYEIHFNSLKEFKTALYNFSQYINQEIKFKHFITYYLTEKYYIKNSASNIWTLIYKSDIKYQNQHCRIFNTKLLTNQLNYNKIKNLNLKILEINNNHIFYNQKYPYSIIIDGKHRSETLKKIKQLEELLEISI